MRAFSTVSELREALLPLRDKTIGFVPTMGALHPGHISLVNIAREQCDVVVVSVFVNPTQFNDKNDLKNYPRTPEADAAMLEAAGVDFVLFPSVEEIYPEPDTRVFDFGQLDKVMEGATRPGHFNGVAQVVSRLFAIVEPTKAYFGEKDFQQIAIVRSMVEQLNIDVEIIDCPIIREQDGLARSSRNVLLTEAHRQAAPRIYAALSAMADHIDTMSAAELEKWATEQIEQSELLKVIYLHIVDPKTLQRLDTLEGEARVCVAVQAGDVRLIDNVKLK